MYIFTQNSSELRHVWIYLDNLQGVTSHPPHTLCLNNHRINVVTNPIREIIFIIIIIIIVVVVVIIIIII